jgi:glutathione S-transferase
MTITLYQAPMSSASPVVWAMAELGLDHESVAIDLKGTQHKQPEFLALNPMGQVPTLVVDGQPMFESCAITAFIGDTYGVERGLWPASGTPQRMIALTWVCWCAVTVGCALRRIFANTPTWSPETHSPAQLERAMEQFGDQMRVIDGHLDGRAYIAGDTFTLADCYASATLAWATRTVQFNIATTPHLAAWLDRCMSRPGAKLMEG